MELWKHADMCLRFFPLERCFGTSANIPSRHQSGGLVLDPLMQAVGLDKHYSVLVHPNNCSTKIICISEQEAQVEDICFRPHRLEEAWNIDRENDISLGNSPEGEQDRCLFHCWQCPRRPIG